VVEEGRGEWGELTQDQVLERRDPNEVLRVEAYDALAARDIVFADTHFLDEKLGWRFVRDIRH
jgi:hypothetical protein